MSDTRLALAADFDAVDDAQWRVLVEKSLKGKPFEKAMSSRTYDDVEIKALYTPSNSSVGARPQMRDGDWQVVTAHWNPDIIATREAILEDLERGTEAIALRIAAGSFPGIPAESLGAVLDGVYLNMASFILAPGEEFETSSAAMLGLLAERGHDPATINGCLGADPIGTLAQTGRLLSSPEQAVSACVATAQTVAAQYDGLETFMVDSGLYHIGGATEAQELGLMLATGLQYLRAMEADGMDLAQAANQIRFSLAADADIFVTISKFRAARLLWAQVLESCGVTSVDMKLSGVTSLRMMSVCDPWVNILRGTTACFAAGVGGADAICVLPHDTMLGVSGKSARRIARNIQIILQEESSISKVMDPAAGALSFESITLELSNKAWEYFTKIESKGGMLAALQGGLVQQDLHQAWATKHKNIATRRDAMTGVSEFPNIHEAALTDIGVVPASPETIKPAGAEVQSVMFHRQAESFEAFRTLGESFAERGVKPAIFLASIGGAADYTGRATFSKNLFEAGGIEALPSEGGDDLVAITAAYKASGAPLAVICSSDALYETYSEQLLEALKAAGAAVYIAGKPKNLDALTESGLDGAVYVGVNVLEVYEHAYKLIGEAS
ncbi:MAG: methylmalonyl-CoA mutase subunit beta [Kordiimonadaceae bacterium]|nr:methylmalonyl-CoA mutase subunit beta [Kordiimonadaceae bacterium]